MMNCDRAKELFSGLHEGTLSPGLGEAVRRHLDNCAQCEADFQEFSALYSSLSALPPVEAPPSLHERIMGDVERAIWAQKEALRPRTRLQRFKFALALGGLVALVVTGLLVREFLPGGKHQASLLPSFSSPILPAPPVVSLDSQGRVAVEVKAYEDMEIKVFQGGSDLSSLPPRDARLLHQKRVPSGESFSYTVEPPLPSQGTALYWMATNIPGRVSLIVVPAKGTKTSQKASTSLVSGLKALAEAYGVPIDALIGADVPGLVFDPSVPSAEDSARFFLKGTPYTSSLQGGILRIR